MGAQLRSALVLTSVFLLASATAGCGEFVRQDRSPVTLVVNQLEAGAGAEPDVFQGTLRSDVRTIVDGSSTIFDDMGRVTMSLILKDPGQPGVTNVPSPINSVTIRRYRVTFRRADGRNTAGVDVPFPFDSATTFTVPPDGTAQAVFELVRHTSKIEPPLGALAGSSVIISTIADVTFFGRDQAGNDVSVTGSIGVLFGDFADEEE